MKYVKIFDSKMMPCGVIDIEGDMSSAEGKYVKVIGANMQVAGVIQLGNEMSDAEKALLFQVYDQNLMLVGVGVAGSLSPSDPTAIDLGLPSGTKWRSMNLGASAPEEVGMYFQWGDTQGYTADQVGSGTGKKAFASDFSDYKYFENDAFTKYNSTDGKTTLESGDDAAVAALANPWVMPTKTQFEELINSEYTTTEWVTVNGVAGRRITSKSNGNSVFLPAAGVASDGSVGVVGGGGYYWSSSLGGEDENFAWYLYFDDGDVSVDDGGRFDGFSVRPVQNASV